MHQNYFQTRVIQPIKCQCCPHIETRQLICTENYLIDFHMRATLVLDGLINLSRPRTTSNIISSKSNLVKEFTQVYLINLLNLHQDQKNSKNKKQMI